MPRRSDLVAREDAVGRSRRTGDSDEELNVAMATTLFAIGANMGAPKWPRALSTWLSIAYRP